MQGLVVDLESWTALAVAAACMALGALVAPLRRSILGYVARREARAALAACSAVGLLEATWAWRSRPDDPSALDDLVAAVRTGLAIMPDRTRARALADIDLRDGQGRPRHLRYITSGVVPEPPVTVPVRRMTWA